MYTAPGQYIFRRWRYRFANHVTSIRFETGACHSQGRFNVASSRQSQVHVSQTTWRLEVVCSDASRICHDGLHPRIAPLFCSEIRPFEAAVDTRNYIFDTIIKSICRWRENKFVNSILAWSYVRRRRSYPKDIKNKSVTWRHPVAVIGPLSLSGNWWYDLDNDAPKTRLADWPIHCSYGQEDTSTWANFVLIKCHDI